MTTTSMTFDDMAVALEQSCDYRVLKRLALERILHPADGQTVRSGLFVDVETTGLDPTRDEIIEIAMIPFSYGLDGKIYEVFRLRNLLKRPDDRGRQTPPHSCFEPASAKGDRGHASRSLLAHLASAPWRTQGRRHGKTDAAPSGSDRMRWRSRELFRIRS